VDNNKDYFDAGSDILKSVSKAIDTNDYSKLASEISDTIKSVSYERRTTYSSGNYRRSTPKQDYPFMRKKISKYLGVADMFFGAGIGVFFLFPLFIGSFMIDAPILAAITGSLLAFSVFATIRGGQKLKLAKKFHQYGNILRDADYFAIKDLAKVAMKSDEEVLKDIKDMIKAGFLPRARLDRNETTCMITDEAYDMYLGAEKDRAERELRQAAQDEELRKQAQAVGADASGVKGLIEEGNEYIRFVRQINDVIPDTEEMSNKLYRLESIMNRIFEQVKKDPSSADELHKLMIYYLPTTKKLLSAYVELDKQPDSGENVRQTKQEIDLAMDTINEAFEHLLDSLFQDMAWDISSDISVMKTMMAQDGLTSEGSIAAQAGGEAYATASQGQTLTFGKE
jgi:5-bromo-4-chloroindolyl phosphate hydrolysis protein